MAMTTSGIGPLHLFQCSEEQNGQKRMQCGWEKERCVSSHAIGSILVEPDWSCLGVAGLQGWI